MTLTDVKQHKNGDIKVTIKKDGKIIRSTTLQADKEYVIVPLNPLKKKNRDRRCLFIKVAQIGASEDWKRTVARVKYLDKNSYGYVDFDELVAVE